MAINTGKVVAGGLAAGVVMNVIDYLVQTMVLGSRFKAQLDAVAPSISVHFEGTGAMVSFIVIDFVIGIAAVWTYAAMRPRFGPGPGTAVRAALPLWILGGTGWYSYVIGGMMDTTLYGMAAIAALVCIVAGSVVGAMVYKEE